MASNVKAVSGLYGGFWNLGIRDFCYMTNRYFPPEEFVDAIAENIKTLLGSYPSTNRHLSSLLADQLGVREEEVVVANGASELISAALSLRARHVAIPIPTFDEYRNRAIIQGHRVSEFMMEEDFNLNVEGFIGQVKEAGVNSVVIVRPNNPTGTLVSRDEMTEMLRAFRDLDMVLVDESFLFFAESGYSALSIADLIHDTPNLVIVNSMSKAYGIPGLRLGYAASGDQEFVARLRSNLPIWNVNSIAQFFLENLGAYNEQFVESCAQVRRAAQSLYWGLRSIPFLHPYPTQGNYILCRTTSGLSGSEVTASLFDEHRILVNDCSGKRGLDSRFFRIASRTTEENDEVVRTLRRMARGPSARVASRR